VIHTNTRIESSRPKMMSNKPARNTAPRQQQQPCVYVTSLKSIAASSPSKTNWASPPPSPPSPARKVLRRLFWPMKNNNDDDTSITRNIDPPFISDSLSGSQHLQSSIMMLTESMDEHEVHCCKKDEASDVIKLMEKKAKTKIDEGNLNDALTILNNSLALQQKLYGKKSPQVAQTLNTMGEVLSNLGDEYMYMAMSTLEESLAIRMELEPGSEDTALTLKNLWMLFHKSNVAISSDDKKEETIFDSSSQVH